MNRITIKGEPVIDVYESFDGSYWFATEKAWTQDSVIGGKLYENDQILYGYVRLSSCPDCAEFGYFSESELKRLGPRVWIRHFAERARSAHLIGLLVLMRQCRPARL